MSESELEKQAKTLSEWIKLKDSIRYFRGNEPHIAFETKLVLLEVTEADKKATTELLAEVLNQACEYEEMMEAKVEGLEVDFNNVSEVAKFLQGEKERFEAGKKAELKKISDAIYSDWNRAGKEWRKTEKRLKAELETAEQKNVEYAKLVVAQAEEYAEEIGKLEKRISETHKFPIVTLCGSSKQKADWEHYQKEIALKGYCVLAINVYFGLEDTNYNKETPTKQLLRELHFQKIRMADIVAFIRKPDGTLGEHTTEEFNFAMSLNKQVVWADEFLSKVFFGKEGLLRAVLAQGDNEKK